VHRLYPATAELKDEAGHELITAYAAKRPDGEWSLLVVNKDPSNAHEISVAFDDGGQSTPAQFSGVVKMATFGTAEYVWHSEGAKSYAEPDGPAKHRIIDLKQGQKITLPKASIVVLTGRVDGR
jgi:hypothetical protein